MGKEFTIIAKFTVPANAPAYSTIPVKFVVDPRRGEEPALQVPKGEAWVIKDIYVTSAPGVDAKIELFKNDDEKVLDTDPLSALIQSNPAKPKYKPIVYEEFAKLSAVAITLAAGGSSDTEVVFYIKAEKAAPTATTTTAVRARRSIRSAFHAIVP